MRTIRPETAHPPIPSPETAPRSPRPELALVSTEWVAEHRTDPQTVLVEVDRDPTLYAAGHIPGAVDWRGHPSLTSSIGDASAFRDGIERLMGEAGIDNYSTLVLYGDDANVYAAHAFWRLTLAGHIDLRLMDGGRDRWLAEGRPTSQAVPEPVSSRYRATPPNPWFRTTLEEARGRAAKGTAVLIDSGSDGARVPETIRIPWTEAVHTDGRFKSIESLRPLFESHEIAPDLEIATYAADGPHSAHTWFVLARILGYPRVRNIEAP